MTKAAYIQIQQSPAGRWKRLRPVTARSWNPHLSVTAGRWKRLRSVTEGTTLGSTLGLRTVIGDGTLTGCPNRSSDISFGVWAAHSGSMLLLSVTLRRSPGVLATLAPSVTERRRFQRHTTAKERLLKLQNINKSNNTLIN